MPRRRHPIFTICLFALLAILLPAGCALPAAEPLEAPLLDAAVAFDSTVVDELPPRTAYRIGLQTEVTGDGAAIGDLSIRAARLAVEEINAAGGIGGVPLELLVRDVGSDPAQAVIEYRAALAEDNLVALLGPFKSAYAVGIVPEHRTATLPMFIGATNATLTDQGDAHLFRMRPSDKVTAGAMAAFAMEQLGARRVGIIHDTDAFGSGGAAQVALELTQRGMEPVLQLGYKTGTVDLDSVAQSLAEADIDAVLIYGTNGTDVGRLLRSIRYWNIDAPIITSPGGATIPTRNIAAEAQDGIYVVMDAVLEDTPAGARFREEFNDRFGLEPDTYTTWTYDAVRLLAEVLQSSPEARGAALSDRIRATRFQGAQGEYHFDQAGDGLHTVTLARMRNGTAEPLGVFQNGTLLLNEVGAAAGRKDRP